MQRHQQLDRLASQTHPWDMLIIGGGATGVAVALDAASRGYQVALLEQSDFGKGTSSRSTKLAHGGVRYLQQGNISLVIEALKERGLLRRNAPHLVHDLAFVVPNYDWWEAPFYGIGMQIYDLLAGRYGFGRSRLLSKKQVRERIPTLEPHGLRGGVLYYDGQFDDARLLLNMAQTAIRQGACLVNYMQVTGLLRNNQGFVSGVEAHDLESNRALTLHARCVINATGAFADSVRRMDDPQADAMIAPSQGVHLVLDGSFLPGQTAIMVPRTSDKRVMFAIPWHGHTLLGTTDTPIDTCELEPRPLAQEIDFILETAAPYLEKQPARSDILSAFAGIRPLVRGGQAGRTAALSRDHTIEISRSGMLSIAGGKWTTCRKMAQDCVDHAATLAQLPEQPCVTAGLNLHGYLPHTQSLGPLAVYGSDAEGIARLMQENPQLAAPLHPQLPIVAAQVIWAVRHEMARTVEDVLARRTRALFLRSQAAMEMAPATASLMAGELKCDQAWQTQQVEAFYKVAANFVAA